MKYLFTFFFLSCSLPLCQAQVVNRYPITIHVVKSDRDLSSLTGQTLLVQINGNYYDLAGPLGKHGKLDPGDYQARLWKNVHQSDESTVIYELLLSNKRTRRFVVSGDGNLPTLFIPMVAEAGDCESDWHARSQATQPQPKKQN